MCLRESPSSFGPGPIAPAALGGQDDPLARPRSLSQRADDLLGGPGILRAGAQRVDVRRVEEGDARRVGRVHDGEGGGLVRLEAEGHRAQADLAHAQPGAPHPLDLHRGDRTTRRAGASNARAWAGIRKNQVESNMNVEIWSDVVCPWCYIGKRRFELALAGFAHRDGVDVVYRSFQLDPDASSAESEPVLQHLARKYGTSRRAGGR